MSWNDESGDGEIVSPADAIEDPVIRVAMEREICEAARHGISLYAIQSEDGTVTLMRSDSNDESDSRHALQYIDGYELGSDLSGFFVDCV